MSQLEDKFEWMIIHSGLPKPEREYRFHPKRRWRFDFGWAEHKIAAEVEGGIWRNGRHTRGNGFEKDLEKYNAAMLLGWDVARFSSGMVESGEAIKTLEMLFELKKLGGY